MMQFIRDRAQGIVAWVIVAMIAIVFTFWGVSGYISLGGPKPAAIVNGNKISTEEIDAIYNRTLRYYATQKNFDSSKLNPTALKTQITHIYAEQQAVIAGLEREHFAISDNVLFANMRQDPNFQENGSFSKEKFLNTLNMANVSEAEYEESQRDALLQNQVQHGLLESSFATKNEIDNIIKIRSQQRDFGYAIIAANKFLTGAKVTEAQISEYYNKHAASFVVPETVSLEYLELSIDDQTQQVDVTEQKLREYYQNNLQSFGEPELFHIRHIMVDSPNDAGKTKIDAIYKQLKDGADFVQLAKKESADTQTAANGGDLGWIPKTNDLPPEIFNLSKANDFTQPVKTDYGWHIFQLVELKPAKTKDFSEVKNIVAARYKREAAEKLFSAKGEELANLTFENPKSLEPASQKLNLPIISTGSFSHSGGDGIAQSKNVLNAAFSDEVLNQGHNSALIRISDDSYVVIRVKDHQPQGQQTLDQARADITKILQKEFANNQAKTIGEELLASLKDGVAPNKAVASRKLQWKSLSNVKRDDKQVPSEVLQQAFMVPLATEGKDAVQGSQASNGDYIVISLSKITDGKLDNEQDPKMAGFLGSQIALMQGRLEFGAFVSDLVAKAKIEYQS